MTVSSCSMDVDIAVMLHAEENAALRVVCSASMPSRDLGLCTGMTFIHRLDWTTLTQNWAGLSQMLT